MWQWDSTVPFNLANLKECLDLRMAGEVDAKLYTGKGIAFFLSSLVAKMILIFLVCEFVATDVTLTIPRKRSMYKVM